LLAHSDARLSDQQKRAICDWTKAERARLRGSGGNPDHDEDRP
jgi:hypothetical protein